MSHVRPSFYKNLILSVEYTTADNDSLNHLVTVYVLCFCLQTMAILSWADQNAQKHYPNIHEDVFDVYLNICHHLYRC